MNKNDAQKYVRISHDMYKDDDTNHDYLEEDADMDDLVIPSLNIDNLRGDGDGDGGERNAKPLQVQIT